LNKDAAAGAGLCKVETAQALPVFRQSRIDYSKGSLSKSIS